MLDAHWERERDAGAVRGPVGTERRIDRLAAIVLDGSSISLIV